MVEPCPEVYVVILAYNHVEDTLECLASVFKQNYANLYVVVVDSGSSDGTPAIVRERFPQAGIIAIGRNLGVPSGYNIGFAVALRYGAKYVFMLNNDTVLAPDAIDQLVTAAVSNPDVAIAMPKVLRYDEPNSIWTVGARRRLFPPAIVSIGTGRDAQNELTEKRFLEFAIGCSVLIHRRAFEAAGLLDPGYFFFFEDFDFSERVRAHGMKILYVPTARIFHKVSRSTRQSGTLQRFYHVYGESVTRFYRRHGRPVALSLAIHLGYIVVREIVMGNGNWIGAFAAGVRSGLIKPLGSIPTVADVLMHMPEPTELYKRVSPNSDKA